MSKQKLVLIGGGGHCKACIDVIELSGKYSIEGILDSIDLIGSDVLGYKIIGTDDDISKYKAKGCEFLITVGQIKSSEVRQKIYEILILNNVSMATIISPKARVSKHAHIGYGSIIMHNAVVNANAFIGNNCILNTGCIIEHDVIVGSHTHISTAAVVNGESKIGNNVFIGSNSTISNHVTIANNILIGAGAVVLKNIDLGGTYVGNPVRTINL